MTLFPRRHSIVAVLLACMGCTAQGRGPAEAGPPAEVAGPPVAVAEPPAAEVAGASYTEAQAARGLDVFRGTCSECHYRSDFRGTQFQFEWRRRSVEDFYKTIVETMPEDDPGVLSAQQYIDVVAFFLSLNGFSSGADELVADQDLLRGLSMAAPGNGGP